MLMISGVLICDYEGQRVYPLALRRMVMACEESLFLESAPNRVLPMGLVAIANHAGQLRNKTIRLLR